MADVARGLRRHPAPPPKEYGPPEPRVKPTRRELRDWLRGMPSDLTPNFPCDAQVRRAVFGRWRQPTRQEAP